MSFGGILNSKSSMQTLICFMIFSCESAVRVIVFRKETCSSQDDAWHAVFGSIDTADAFCGKLCHPIHVPWFKRAASLIKPHAELAVSSRIVFVIITEVVEVKMNRSHPADLANSSKFSVPPMFVSTKA